MVERGHGVEEVSDETGSLPESGFTFVPATLNQSMGANAKAFYLPTNAEGTMTRPVIYLRRDTERAVRA